jgi:hypothetical protein
MPAEGLGGQGNVGQREVLQSQGWEPFVHGSWGQLQHACMYICIYSVCVCVCVCACVCVHGCARVLGAFATCLIFWR